MEKRRFAPGGCNLELTREDGRVVIQFAPDVDEARARYLAVNIWANSEGGKQSELVLGEKGGVQFAHFNPKTDEVLLHHGNSVASLFKSVESACYGAQITIPTRGFLDTLVMIGEQARADPSR
jgi:hypothetical protein